MVSTDHLQALDANNMQSIVTCRSECHPCEFNLQATGTYSKVVLFNSWLDDRFELAKASRVWRQGVPTALIMDQGLHMLQDAAAVQVLINRRTPSTCLVCMSGVLKRHCVVGPINSKHPHILTSCLRYAPILYV